MAGAVVPGADCEQYPAVPRAVSRLEPRRPAAVRCWRPRRSRSRRASPSCVADEGCVCTDSRCTRFRACCFVEALALGQKIVPPFREVSSAPSEARSSLSAFVLGERRDRGVARRSSRRCRPIGENSDYQTSTPSPRRIRARRILTKRRRGAGAVLFAARRGAAMASRPHRAAPAASTTSRCSQRQESSFSNRCSPTRTGRVRVL